MCAVLCDMSASFSFFFIYFCGGNVLSFGYVDIYIRKELEKHAGQQKAIKSNRKATSTPVAQWLCEWTAS
jgi:hypothetical protein